MKEALVTVVSFSTAPEAHLAKSKLEASGIDATVVDDQTVSINWLYSNAVGGVKVKVLKKDLERARAILKTGAQDTESRSRLEANWEACPVCGSMDVEYFSDKRGPFMTWLCLGFPILPARKRLKCLNCGHIWKYEK